MTNDEKLCNCGPAECRRILSDGSFVPPPDWLNARRLLKPLMVALEDLSLECDGVIGTRQPSIDTYNRTFRVLMEARQRLGINVARDLPE